MSARIALIAAAVAAAALLPTATQAQPTAAPVVPDTPADSGWDGAEQQQWAAACEDQDDWDKPGPPFRIYGNSYYVGTCGITAILVIGDQGNVLIDSGTRVGADVVAANIEKLGFKLSDVKLLLTSHEHFDHVGGIAELQRRTGAKLLASPAAAPVMASGEPSELDPQNGILDSFAPARVDGILEDGKPVKLGSLTFVPVFTPGHTPGAVSWQWRSCAGNTCATMVYADSLSPISSDSYRFSDHPDYVALYRLGLQHLSQLSCTIVLTPHPSASGMRKRLAFGSPFGEPSCRAYAESIGKRLDARLAEEAAR
ncbi:subclass B3 metallo-beta-lactamase [Altererythrobacter sp. B11]|uniref:subclass B3 metallo-beta-lactamase n=1 Tax=Altererythrobacter sp. B11 TaxID=2060312 RepID=UPI000DC6F57E|nr:subclass B3 metallo-beta-lactamase [Altererythrobacter sp. B11]BBC72464.1 subclass B3 metallo-beta-lactamase [Altererythrobacter sp. B11]